MGEDLRTRFLAELVGAAEVVGVRMGDDRGVDPPQRDTGGVESHHQRRPRLGPGKAGVDERETVAVFEGVGVDVAESGHGDRQLHPENPGRHLDHLFGGGFLFLLRIDGFGHPGTLLG